MATQRKQRPQYSFDRYLNIRSAHSPTFSPDSSRIAFVSDITGVPQLWEVPVDGGWPTQVTFTSDRVMGGHYSHRQNQIVFGMDDGGNEREQLFVLNGAETMELAVDPEVIHTFGAIAPDDSAAAFSDNRRHPAYFDVYTSKLDGSGERCVYQQDGSNFVSDWSDDGRKLLINRRTGPLDSELFLLDLSDKVRGDGSVSATHLTPHSPPTLYENATFAPDATSIYFKTDQESEFTRAARMDLATRKIEFLTRDEVDVTWLSLSKVGRRLAIVRNEEGYGRLTVRDGEGGAERTAPGLPDGVVQDAVWANDGQKLAFTFNSPGHNLNIWLWDFVQDECHQVTFAATGGIPQETHVRPELIHYSSFDGRSIPAFFYMPDLEQPPVVVQVHGGPESQSQPSFSAVTQYLVNRGYAVLSPNVRGSTGYGRTYTHLDDVDKRLDSVADLKAAVEWLRESGKVDGDRVAVMGGSYGGFMTLSALTTYPELWTAGVDIVGIANFETFLRNTGAYRRHWRIPEYGDPDHDEELLRQISPIHHVDRINAPLIVIQGDNDPRVPLSESEQIVDAVKRRGLPVEFLRFPDEGHGLVKLKNKLVAYSAIGEFLDKHLGTKGNREAGNEADKLREPTLAGK